ncbi:MAG: sulfite exporter TauE/SafE family protein [Sphingomonadales bacterium]|nr:sulfite exporter TauE/SafE family protein [Sphingomonadales bacterium]
MIDVRQGRRRGRNQVRSVELPEYLIGHVDLMHATAGLLVGVLVGLTGVGGGSLMTPLLVLMFGVNAKTAVGTDLLFAALTKTVGSTVHGWRDTVDWRIFRRLAAGSIPAAIVSVVALQWLGEIGNRAEHLIIIFLGCMLILTAFAALFQTQLVRLARRRGTLRERRVVIPTIALGAFIGVAVSISSVGAGAIGVTALLMLYPHLPVSRIVGTDIVHAVPLALLAGSGHWLYGDVDLVLLGSLLVGSIPGVIVGSLLSSRAPDHLLRPALAAVLLLSGLKLLTS